MSYSQHIIWEIVPLEQPKVIKHCSKCGVNKGFVNSGKFRVNANKKHLDIWLIYQCESCKSTYNLTVYERINPKTLSSEVLKRYMENDSVLAEQTGFNSVLHAQNRVVLDLGNLAFDIVGDLPRAMEKTLIEIRSPKGLTPRLDQVLSQKLNLSRERVKRHLQAGVFRSVEGDSLSKEKAKDKMKFLVLEKAENRI